MPENRGSAATVIKGGPATPVCLSAVVGTRTRRPRGVSLVGSIFSVLTVLTTSAFTSLQQVPTAAQSSPPLLSVDIRPSDYELSDLARVIRGQVAVTLAEDGPSLSVWSLADRPVVAQPMQLASAAPALGRGGCFDLALESDPVLNALGGRYGTFALGGSSAETDQDLAADGRRVLRVRCNRGDGACGLWIHLYETDNALRRTFLDASRIAKLVFWAKSRTTADAVLIKAADAAWARREDALPVGTLASFAATPPDGWRRFEVSLDALPPRLARDSLASLVFEARGVGASELELSGLQLCAAGGVPAPLPLPATADSANSPALHRAVWVWNTREITSDADQREKLLDFVEAQGFDRVFLQLVPADGQVARAGWVPFDADRMGELVALLKSRGASVYALDGDPSYALPENHAGVLRTVSAILEHNRTAPAERSFDGVRYDIEPYLLPSFRGDGRDALLAGYVELVSAVASTARGSLRVGLDVPFWLDAPEPSTGEPISATWRGDRRPILDHLVRLVDDVAVMAYRTSAYGMDGSLSQAHGELRAASAAGADVYIGLETEQLPDEDAYGFQGAPQPGPPSVGGPWIVMAPLSERVARVWLVPPGAESSLAALLAEAGALPEQVVHWRADPPAHIAAERQSFQRLGWERLRTEADRIARALRGSPAFAGVAYHHYGSLLKLLPSGGGR